MSSDRSINADDVADLSGLDIIIGPMYAGKSTELLRRLHTMSEVGFKCVYINHSVDSRSMEAYSTHNPALKIGESSKLSMIKMSNLHDLEDKILTHTDVIGIDEAQFFDDLSCIDTWITVYKCRVIVAGLDSDFRKQKFGKILDLIPNCNSVTKLLAYCEHCSKKRKVCMAPFTARKIMDTTLDDTVVSVGSHDKYSALCRNCHANNNKSQKQQ